MNRDLDRIIFPLERKAPEDHKKWMELQARYNRWMQSVCSIAEELNWVDFETRLRSDGTARGSTETACQTSLAAERGVFAAQVAAGDFQALRAQLQLAQQSSEPKRAQVKDVLALLKAAEARPPPPVDEKDQGVVRPITPREWHDLRSRVEGALTTAAELARDQCALLPALGEGCPTLLERSLVAMMPISNLR